MTLQNLQSELAELMLANDTQTELVDPAFNIAIYHNNMTTNLVHALQDTYPLISQLVGNDFFRITAKEYIERYPSRSGNLHDYGQYFSDFLAEYQPVKTLHYLSEVAQFEWICHTLYFAANHSEFDTSDLAHLSPDAYGQLHFLLHPASQLMKFYYPIARIIDLCRGEIEGNIDINEGGAYMLIIRRESDIKLVSLSLAEFTFLTALHDSKPLSQALDMAMQLDSSFSLEEKLPSWIQDKTIVDCYVAD